MDIITIRSWFQNRGCQAVLIVVAVLLGVGMIAPMVFSPAMRGGNPALEEVYFKAAGKEIKAKDYEDASKMQRSSSVDPMGRLNEIGGVINQLVEEAAITQLAAKYAVKMTDAQLRQQSQQQLDTQLMIMRFQLQNQGKIKQNATDKDFEAALKEATGQTVEQLKKTFNEGLETSLKDPEKRAAVEKQFLRAGIADAIATKVAVSEDDLKKGYDTFTVNRLAFMKPGQTADQKKAEADKARAELAAGKPFAEIAKKYTGKPAEAPTDMMRSMLESDPSLKPLLDVKAKEISPVLDVYGSPTIYQVVKIEQKLPADYEKSKATLLTGKKSEMANKQLTTELDGLKKSSAIEWKNKSLQAVYDVYQATGPERTGKKKEDFEKLYEEALASNAATPTEGGAMAVYAALDEVYRLSTTDQQKELKEKRVEALNDVLQYLENNNLRMDLLDLQVELKLNEDAYLTLETAAQNNTGDFESVNDSMAVRVETRAAELEKKGVITKEQGDAIRKINADWRKEKVQVMAERAELAKIEAEQKAKDEAEEKKMMEEEKKKEAEEAKKKATSATSTPPTSKPASPLSPAPAPAGAGK